MMKVNDPLLTVLFLATSTAITMGFSNLSLPAHRIRSPTKPTRGLAPSYLSAKAQKKKKKPTKGGGGGFGGGKSSPSNSSASSAVPTVSADKNSLEKQWDAFASITDLEIAPKGSPDDEDLADVFVRCGPTKSNAVGTKWFRIGKVCTSDDTSMDACLTLQKGLIFWTAVHMRRELVAAGGGNAKSGAGALELGFVTPATLTMGSESDGPLDDDEEHEVHLHKRSSLKGVQSNTFGFRPDWNPPGFTYKRREKAAMKKKISKLDELKEVSAE